MINQSKALIPMFSLRRRNPLMLGNHVPNTLWVFLYWSEGTSAWWPSEKVEGATNETRQGLRAQIQSSSKSIPTLKDGFFLLHMRSGTLTAGLISLARQQFLP